LIFVKSAFVFDFHKIGYCYLIFIKSCHCCDCLPGCSLKN